MTTEPMTLDELRQEVADVLVPYALSVDQFVSLDVDDLPSDALRDLWLMVRGALTPAE